MACDPGQLARESKKIALVYVVKRLLAEAVAGEKQPPPRFVVDGEGEHAVEALRETFTPFLVAVDQDFRVGVIAVENVAPRLEFAPQLGVVVDLAVEDHADATVFIPHRLSAALNVEDSKAAMAEEHAG